ncbi:MAG TPA: DUF6599 family protein [Verrucomicrobiae bacterium]|jgi:hypothetical protein|nr:DUF6599 family protein [Verrucomicrobiae bacterium]
MRKLIVVSALLAFLCTSVYATNSVLPDRFGAWEAAGPSKATTLKDLGPDWTQGTNAEQVLKESGLSTIEERSYHSGQDQITLRLFTLKDPSSAYEFYTFLLAPGMRNMGIGQDSALSQTDGRILIGNFVVQATLSPKIKPESLSDLAAALKAKSDPTPFPPLKSYLPEEWLVFGSQKYALGPEAFRSAMRSLGEGAYAGLSKEVGFDDHSEAEAILARYQGEHGSGVLLLLEYPTPQVAENRLHHLQDALPASAKQAGVTVERKASLLSVVFAATSAMHAQAIRDAVNYDTQVTWNEPHQAYTDPPLVQMLYKIFLFTSLFLVVATLTGIAFGGFRILIKHWWPGKVFDRPENIEVLQLGLTSKKIDPSDLY